ncbi:MAG: hypothetical protein GTO18_09415 [Anaerolineales bacterium]|nr:hypothetical protein [Anaerolineales bacterium]
MTLNKQNMFNLRTTRIVVSLFSLIMMLVGAGCAEISSAAAGSSEDLGMNNGPSVTDDMSAPGFGDPDPDLVEDCLDQGGVWMVLGMAGEGCNLPTEDGGKACSDWSDCESVCLADDPNLFYKDSTGFLHPDREIIERHNSEYDQLSGACSAWQSNFGCNVILEDGKYVGICID